MGESLTALFFAPQLFVREWIEIGSGGVLLFFVLLYLSKRRQLVFAGGLTGCLLLAAIFQSIAFPFWQFLAEKGALVLTGILVVKLLFPTAVKETMLSLADLAPLIFQCRQRRSLFLFPTNLALAPYLKSLAPAVPLQKEPLEEWLSTGSEAEIALLFDQQHKQCSLIEVKGKGEAKPLQKALYLSAKTDAHIFATEEGSLYHIFREKEMRIESVEKLAASLQQLDEKRG